MSFADENHFPTGIYYSDLTGDLNPANEIYGDTNRKMKICGCIISNDNAAAQELRFASDGGFWFIVFYIPPDDSIIVPFGFETEDGLKINMAANTADVKVTLFYKE